MSKEEQSTHKAEEHLRPALAPYTMPRDMWFRARRPCNFSSRNDREKLRPTWWAGLYDGHSKCGIYGFLHFLSPWWTSRGDCPVCEGFSGHCLVCAPCPQMWDMVVKKAFPPLQAHGPTLWSKWWLNPCKLLQSSLNFLPKQIHTHAIHLICSPCISCDTL